MRLIFCTAMHIAMLIFTLKMLGALTIVAFHGIYQRA